MKIVEKRLHGHITARISGSQPQDNEMSLDVDASPLHPVVQVSRFAAG